ADCCHMAAFDIYTWGGFSFGIADLGDEPRDSYFMPTYAVAESPDVFGIPVTTRGGAAVGWAPAQILALGEPSATFTYEGVVYLYLDPTEPSSAPDPPKPARSVQLISDPSGSTIVQISSPGLA